MDRLNRHPLTALRALEVTGRVGSLAKAAEELRVTTGAVSQHIRNAEAQLGRSVFERTPRGPRATPVGVQLLASLTLGFHEIARAVAVAEAQPSAVLTVSVAPVLAAKWLVPRFTRFYAAHLRLQLRIDASSQLVDFDISDVDAGVRVGAARATVPPSLRRTVWVEPISEGL
jgi:LysR family glycine cleavage system transcriptional activator